MPEPFLKSFKPYSSAETEYIKQRLYRRRQIDPITQCWNWTGTKNPKGYGRIDIQGKHRSVPQVSWEVHIGVIGDRHALHTCDNPSCFNPDHLFIGTDKDNQQDRISKGRNHHFSAKLTPSQVSEIRTMFSTGWDRRAIATHFNVHYTTVRDIINGRYWSGGL